MNRRAIAVMRMHLTDQVTLLLMPLGVLASAFALNIVIWRFVPPDGRQTGGAVSIYSFVAAAALYAVVRGLPFALGMGSSRRAFTYGTLLTGGTGYLVGTVLGVIVLGLIQTYISFQGTLSSWWTKIFIGLLLGVLIGHFWPELGVAIKPLADAFLRMIKMIIAPLLFATLVVGIAGTGDLKSMGRIGLKAMVYFEVGTPIALFIGLALVNVFRPGASAPLELTADKTDLAAMAARQQTS